MICEFRAATIFAARFSEMKLRRSQLTDNGDAAAGANAVCPGVEYGVSGGSGADVAGGLDPRPIADYAAHQRDIVSRGGAQEAGSRFQKISLGRKAEFEAQDFFFQSQQRSFQD